MKGQAFYQGIRYKAEFDDFPEHGFDKVLNIIRLEGCNLAPEVNDLIQKREKARLDKDWQAADAAREELTKKGFTVIDTENGPVWRRI